MNAELAAVVSETHGDRALAPFVFAAHELGHGLGHLNVGVRPKRVRLTTGFFGGVTGGMCDVGDPRSGWPLRKKIGRLISDLAGLEAEVRFCHVYLGMSRKEAYRDSLPGATTDYRNFREYREEFGLENEITEAWAQRKAIEMVNSEGDWLDLNTLRLVRDGEINGRSL